MANTFTKISRKHKEWSAKVQSMNPRKYAFAKGLVMTAAIVLPQVALAQTVGGGSAGFLCYIAQYFKSIVGTAALVVIMMWALEHIFGMSKLHDLVIKVGIGCAMVVGAAALISNSGLTTNCLLT